MILFFDTETTGVPKNYDAPISDVNNWPRLVQLAFIKSDWDGNIISHSDFTIKPQGFTIPNEASKIHGITNEIATYLGSNLYDILVLLHKEIEEAELLVAHNIKFDERIIAAEFFRNNITSSILNKPKVCTMEQSTNFCREYKWPKLSELYYKLFKEFFREHNAKSDIFATYKCFWELIKRGIIRLSKTEHKIQYFSVGDFSEGLASVELNDNWGFNKWGFIDKTGKQIIPCKYDGVGDFSEGLAIIKLSFQVLMGIWDDIPPDRYGFIDITGNEIVPYKYFDAKSFSEGLAGVKDLYQGNIWGFIDKLGNEVIPFAYDNVGGFSEGLAAVAIYDNVGGSIWDNIEKWGFIDKTGKQIIPFIYEDVRSFSNGMAYVKLNDKWGYIDKNGAQLDEISIWSRII